MKADNTVRQTAETEDGQTYLTAREKKRQPD